jgi:transposase
MPPATPGERHVPRPPTTLPLRPLRRGVGLAGATARVLREARPSPEVARRVADAVFYLLRSGRAWRMLPREYPTPWQTVYYHFWKWRRDGGCAEPTIGSAKRCARGKGATVTQAGR